MSVSVDIRGCGQVWAIYDAAGNRLSNFINQHGKACIAAYTWERRLSATQRPCLCCGQEFTSYGKGHRMCDTCHETARCALI